MTDHSLHNQVPVLAECSADSKVNHQDARFIGVNGLGAAYPIPILFARTTHC
jgi:hypothetical protein